ncbi:MAG: hypothetical protein LBI92_06965 [Azoarcus sp.]|jgi:hypothetical protein|nr:hypothetical protein [Azoarcus sp.]
MTEMDMDIEKSSLTPETPGSESVARFDRADGIAAAAKMYIEDLQVESATGPIAERAASVLPRFLDTLAMLCPEHETGPDRANWSLAARLSMRQIIDALRRVDRAAPGALSHSALARAEAEAVRWDFVDRQAPDAGLWTRLGDLFLDSYSGAVVLVKGDGDAVAREYLRALAYHAAAFDQQALKTGFAIAQLIQLVLPHLLLTREPMEAALYGVDLERRGIPVRLARTTTFEGWRLVTVPAADVLSDIHGELTHGQRRAGLEKMDLDVLRAAVAHLRRQWSSSPPTRRHQRHVLDARLSMVYGYDGAVSLLNDDAAEAVSMGTGAWRIVDLSRGGVGATMRHGGVGTGAPRNVWVGLPSAGDLVAFCPEEGTKWHLGVVRRVRMSDSHIELGIATLSASPDIGAVDDGRAVRELCFCDPIRRGEPVRLVGPVGALEDNEPLFVTIPGALTHKLRPLASALRGKSFDLRVYQVV